MSADTLLKTLSSEGARMLAPTLVTAADCHAWIIPGTLDGAAIRRLMSAQRLTIRAVARRMRLTEKQVREARVSGVSGWLRCSEWLHAITGLWFVPSPVALRKPQVVKRKRAAA